MALLKLDKGADKKLKKLSKKDPQLQSRYDETKKIFEFDHTDRRLDFKKHQSLPGTFKIQLVGRNDGKRLLLYPDEKHITYYVFAICKHDEIDQR